MMYRSLSARIFSILISLLLTFFSIYPYSNTFSSMIENLNERGIKGEDDLIDIAIFNEFRMERSDEKFFGAFDSSENPLNRLFLLYYLTESSDIPASSENMLKMIEKYEDRGDIVFKTESSYIRSLISKLDMMNFKASDHGYITDYYFIGPFIKRGILDFEERLEFERSFNVNKRYGVFFKGRKPYKVSSNNGWFDLTSVLSNPFGVNYATASINIPKNGVYYMNFTSLVPYKLFVNGKQIASKRVMDIKTGFKDLIKLEAKKGDLTITVKMDASNSFSGYLFEKRVRGFMIQMFDEKGDPLEIKEGRYKKGKTASHEIMDIRDHYRKYSDIKRYDFKMAYILAARGKVVDAFNVMEGLLRDTESSLYSFFLGYLCERFTELGFSDHAYSYYLNSRIISEDNNLASLFLGRNYLFANNLQKAKNYLMPLRDEMSDKFIVDYFISILRDKEGLRNLASDILRDIMKSGNINMIYSDIFDSFFDKKMYDNAKEVLDIMRHNNIKGSDYYLMLTRYLIQQKDWKAIQKIASDLPGETLSANLLILASQTEPGIAEAGLFRELIKKYPQNMDYYHLLMNYYTKKGDVPGMEQIRREMNKEFAYWDEELDHTDLLRFSPSEMISYESKFNFPIEIIQDHSQFIFSDDLGFRKVNHVIMRINDMQGVNALTNLNLDGSIMFIRVISDDNEYYFHKMHRGTQSLKGLKVGSIVEFSTISYYSRKYLNVHFTGINPVAIEYGIPVHKWRADIIMPRSIRVRQDFLHKNQMKTNYSRKRVAEGIMHSFSVDNVQRYQPEEYTPNHYTYLLSYFVLSELSPEVYIKNYYNEIFDEGFIPEPVIEYFNTFSGSDIEKITALYNDLQVNYSADEQSQKSLWNIVYTKKGNNFDRMKVFKAALDHWKFPNKLVIFSDHTHRDILPFFPEMISGQGIFLNIEGNDILCTFIDMFIPFGGETEILNIAYITDGSSFEVKRNMKVGLGTGIKTKVKWYLDDMRMQVELEFFGLFSRYKLHLFDETQKEILANQTITRLFPFFETESIETVVEKDNEPFLIKASGKNPVRTEGIYEIPLKNTNLMEFFGLNYPRKFPLVNPDHIENIDECIIYTDKRFKTEDIRIAMSGVFEYKLNIVDIPGGYSVKRTLNMNNGVFEPVQLEKIIKEIDKLTKLESEIFRMREIK